MSDIAEMLQEALSDPVETARVGAGVLVVYVAGAVLVGAVVACVGLIVIVARAAAVEYGAPAWVAPACAVAGEPLCGPVDVARNAALLAVLCFAVGAAGRAVGDE